MSDGFYTWASSTTRRLAFLLSQPVITGAENVPAEGGLIVAPNHLHFADPPIISAFFPRPIYYMVKQEAWDAPIVRFFPRNFNAFPVRRGEADTTAYRMALQLLRTGRVLGLFPEGHRSLGGRLQVGQPGAIVLARRSRVPIVPVGIWGPREIMTMPGVFLRHQLHIVIGEPYAPPAARSGDVAHVTAELMERIDRLLPAEHRAPTHQTAE